MVQTQLLDAIGQEMKHMIIIPFSVLSQVRNNQSDVDQLTSDSITLSVSELRHQLSHLKATGLLTRCFLFSQAMWPNSHVPAGLAFAPASLLNCTL